MIPILFHYNAGFWDTAFPMFILNAAEPCIHLEGIERVPDALKINPQRCVLVVPGRHSCDDYFLLNEAMKPFENVVLIVIGDEEGIWHIDRFKHPSVIKWWFMPPFSPRQKVDRVAPNGWPTHAPKMIAEARAANPRRDLTWSFMGQMTHIRRVMCVDGAQGIPNGEMLLTESFTAGVPREEYYKTMVRSKIVLCPAGPCTPDSFRIAEALEAGCIPLADDLTQHASYPPGYFNYVMGENLPFPLIRDWRKAPEIVEEWLDNWELKAERCARWWAAMKQGWIDRMREDLNGRK